MSTPGQSRIPLVVTWTAAVAAATIGILNLHSALQLREEIATLTERRSQLDTHLEDLEHKVATRDRERASLQDTLTALKKERQNLAPITPQASAAADGSNPGDLLPRDAVLQNLYLSVQRAKFQSRYTPVWRMLPLSPKQRLDLEDLIARRDEQTMDIADVVQSNHLDPADPAVAKLRERTAREFESAARALLGASGFEIFRDYERAQPAWELVNKFAGAMALEGQPLEPTQAVHLATALANASPPYRNGGKADLDTVDWSLVAAKSAEVLTPSQTLSFLNSAPFYRVELSSPVPPPISVADPSP